MSKKTYQSGIQKCIQKYKKKKGALANVPKLNTYFSTSASILDPDTSSTPALHKESQEGQPSALVLPSQSLYTNTKSDQQTSKTLSMSIIDPNGFHINNRYPSDRGLYSTAFADESLKYVIANHEPCKPNGLFTTKLGSSRRFSTSRYKGYNSWYTN